MISGWKSEDDCWTNIGSPDIVRKQRFEGYLETPGHGLSDLSGHKKNGLWLLWYGSPELLRQEGTADPRSVLWGCPDLCGGGDSTGLLPGVWESEARETELAFEQSLLHEAICDLCWAEVPGDDGPGCGEGTQIGLAYGKGFGQGVHGGAASTESCCRSWGDWDRRGFAAERAYVSDYRKRFGTGRPIWYGGDDRSEESLDKFYQ